jgi:hypothetical protein
MVYSILSQFNSLEYYGKNTQNRHFEPATRPREAAAKKVRRCLLELVGTTYTPNVETLRACDIIISSSQGRGVVICYVFQHLTTPKSV